MSNVKHPFCRLVYSDWYFYGECQKGNSGEELNGKGR